MTFDLWGQTWPLKLKVKLQTLIILIHIYIKIFITTSDIKCQVTYDIIFDILGQFNKIKCSAPMIELSTLFK